MIAAPKTVQRSEEFRELLAMYRDRAPLRVLEIGTLLGGTLFRWLRNASRGAKVVAVDRDDQVSKLLPNWTPTYAESVFILGDSNSDETAERVRSHGPFDWVFIDAGHFLKEVRRDWELYGSMCAPGGVVIFHDILRDDAYPHIQVWQLWDELKDAYTSEVIGVDTGVLYL